MKIPFTRGRRRYFAVVLALVLVTQSSPASANIGLPMVAVFLPPMWLALLPIIGLETLVCVRMTGAKTRTALLGVGIGNVLSTVVGIPLLWMLLACTEFVFSGTAKGLGSPWAKLYAVTVQAPWLIPYESEFYWMVPAALAVLAVPCFLLSIAIEGLVARPWLRASTARNYWRSIVAANLASYLALAAIFAVLWTFDRDFSTVPRIFEPVVLGLAGLVFSIARLFIGTTP